MRFGVSIFGTRPFGFKIEGDPHHNVGSPFKVTDLYGFSMILVSASVTPKLPNFNHVGIESHSCGDPASQEIPSPTCQSTRITQPPSHPTLCHRAMGSSGRGGASKAFLRLRESQRLVDVLHLPDGHSREMSYGRGKPHKWVVKTIPTHGTVGFFLSLSHFGVGRWFANVYVPMFVHSLNFVINRLMLRLNFAETEVRARKVGMLAANMEISSWFSGKIVVG